MAHWMSEGMAHRDLKPENLMVDAGLRILKVVDFGSVAGIHKPLMDMAGTMPFMAPEILAADNSRNYSSAKCDIWSAGVVLLEMLCGMGKLDKMMRWDKTTEPCYQRYVELKAFFRHGDVALREALESDVSVVNNSLLEVLGGCLKVDLSERWGPLEVSACAWVRSAELDLG